MFKIGDKFRIPKEGCCGHKGKIIGIYELGENDNEKPKTILAVKCNKFHREEDYKRLVKEVVVKLWKGKDAKPYHDLIKSLEYLPGVKEIFKHISISVIINPNKILKNFIRSSCF